MQPKTSTPSQTSSFSAATPSQPTLEAGFAASRAIAFHSIIANSFSGRSLFITQSSQTSPEGLALNNAQRCTTCPVVSNSVAHWRWRKRLKSF